jgi:NADH:ubiquinone oxidoreductase subunit 4 (subunit M)
MVLAGVLLKLGGYGLIRISALFSITRVLKLIVGVSLMGSSLIRIVCLVQSDIKVMIAYSSVVHMGLVIVGFLTLFLRGLEGRIIIIVAHGFCSSALFAGANIIYERSHSRRFNLNTGYLTLIQEFTIF